MSVTPEELNQARRFAEGVPRRVTELWVRRQDVELLARVFEERDREATALMAAGEKMLADLKTIHEVAERNSDVHSSLIHIRRIAASNLIP